MSSSGKPPITIYELATHLGVSTATVSSVLANRHVERRIAEKTAKRIREAALELGYVPNMAGRRLRSHKASTRQFDLAIFTSFEAPLPLVGQALHALQRAVDVQTTTHTRYSVAIEMFHAGRLAEKPGLLEADRYHGVMITNTLHEDDAFLAQAKLPYPVVVLGRSIAGYCCVLEAPDLVGRHAVELLLGAGGQHLTVLRGRSLTHTTSNRLAAFKHTARELTGHEPIELVSEGLQPSQGAAAIDAHLAGGGKVDGLFSVTDSLTIGAYQTLKRRGYAVPDDVAVVGVGDNELAEYFDPPLTTVAGANDAMVAEAVPLLFRYLRGEKGIPQEVLTTPPVLVRASTLRRRAGQSDRGEG
ncbi:LacI family DNA-binding transcriptional regulator [Synoicihabitans lomoniglobus]|uniref:LacI family DNA-binding transcriptional regulator n=1 Tax=Synoicihabitans lomoniglobus TaxID=2909285 RepID=A0AAE9ZSG0_9BACT|nr:LacI family transcriptional regulator [Opitutaceae bacterium LMO-M01]WED63406.1 LacI family DNA-binding transcriptional regulator [Opitutaceae bacterium LMO-M01]